MTSRDLGTLQSQLISRDNYNISFLEPVDVFEFDIVGNRQIGLYLHDIVGGDPDLRLYRDTNNNGILDGRDTLVASSIRGGTLPDTIDYAATTGTYFARVNRASGNAITYDLDLVTTYNIGRVNADIVSRNNFNVSATDPVDIFEFNVVGSRQLGLYLHDIRGGDADLRLYRDSNNNGVFDSSDTLVASSTRGGTLSDTIDVTATTGTYFARVNRFSGGPISYDLDVSRNYDIGRVNADIVSRNNFNVSATDPVDIFEFDVVGSRQLGLYLHDITGGDADLRLYRDSNNNGVFDSSDALVASSTRGGTLSDTIDVAATTGTYFARVNRFSGGPISYDLDFSRNYDIGQVNADIVSRNNFNVSATDPVDIFEFDVVGSRQLGLYLHDIRGGDADLRLYRDSNNNGVFDSSDTLVASSTRGGTLSDTIDVTATTGTYFARVNRFSGGPISYDLDVSRNYDIGRVNADIVSRNNFNVSATDPVDIFEFDVVGSRQLGLYLHDIRGGDADLRLYRDSNSNGVFDSSDALVASSTRGGTLSDTIDVAATTGTYFARVNRFSGGPISYDLDISRNYDIGRVNASPVSRNNFNVSVTDPVDIFEFDIVGSRQIGLYLHDITGGDADLRLYRDSNSNGVFDSSDALVATSALGGTASDTIDVAATTGTYFARVNRFSGGPISYDLDFSATYDVGTVGTTPVSRNNFSVSAADPTDVFEFDIIGTRNINLNLHDISVGDDVDLRLFRDSNNNNVFDAGDLQVASSLRSSNRDDTINYRAATGTYFAQVERFAGGSIGSVTYDLDMSATAIRTPSNLLGTEVQLGNLAGDRILSGGVSNQDTTDTYAFSLGLFEGVNVRLTGLTSDADIRVIRDNNNNGIVEASEVIGTSTNASTASELISNINLSGDYFVQVYQYSGSTSYTLTMDHFTTTFA